MVQKMAERVPPRAAHGLPVRFQSHLPAPGDPDIPPEYRHPQVIDGQKTKTAPALAFYRGKVHMVHLGDSSNTIWHSVHDGFRWSDNVPIPNQKSKATPALAWSHGSLHMVHLDDSSNDLWHSMFTEPVEGYDLTPVRWSWREVGRPLEVVIQNQGNQPTAYESTPWVRVTFLARFAGEQKSDTPDFSYWIREQLMPGGTHRAFVTIPEAAWIHNVCYFKVHVNAGKWDYDADPTNDVLWGKCNR